MLLLYMNWNKNAWSVAQRRHESAEKHISGVTAQTGTVPLSVSPKLLSGQGYAGWLSLLTGIRCYPKLHKQDILEQQMHLEVCGIGFFS